MSRKGRIIGLTALATVAVVICIVMVIASNKRNREAPVVFLPAYGTVQYNEDGDKTLSVAFLSGRDFRDTEGSTPISVTFPDHSIFAKNVELVRSLECNGYALWYLNLDLEIDSTAGNAKTQVCELNMDGNTYPVGLLNIHTVNNDEKEAGHLTVNSCVAASLGLGAAPYHVELENTGTKTVEISGFSDDAYKGAKVTVQKNDDEIPVTLPVSLDAGDTVQIDMDFSGCNSEETVVYYVSPMVTYTCDGQTYHLGLDYYTSGMDLSKQEVKSLCDQYLKEER